MNAGADFLVTHNVRDFEPAAGKFDHAAGMPQGDEAMSKASYLLKMPKSVKAAARLAKEDGVSLEEVVVEVRELKQPI